MYGIELIRIEPARIQTKRNGANSIDALKTDSKHQRQLCVLRWNCPNDRSECARLRRNQWTAFSQHDATVVHASRRTGLSAPNVGRQTAITLGSHHEVFGVDLHVCGNASCGIHISHRRANRFFQGRHLHGGSQSRSGHSTCPEYRRRTLPQRACRPDLPSARHILKDHRKVICRHYSCSDIALL